MSEIETDWELGSAAPGGEPGAWVPTKVPGTVAATIEGISGGELDGRDWWYRTRIAPERPGRLVFEGIATVADVYLDGVHVARSETMFMPLEVPVRAGSQELRVCCRAMTPLLSARRSPRQRWRTKLVKDGGLRFYRTMLLGRNPGFAPGPAVVGIYRPVSLQREQPAAAFRVRAAIRESDGCGVVTVTGPKESLGSLVELSGVDGRFVGRVGAPLIVPEPTRWWPHTHGEPVLHRVEVGGQFAAEVGFRTLGWRENWEADGLALTINGVETFCRGALWTPISLESPHATLHGLRSRLELVVAAGMNMLRIPGTAMYEQDAFHALCDRMGILLWQDFMFANLDYPERDPGFMATVDAEVKHHLDRIAGRPSFVVACGGSECAQQATMMGLDPSLAQGPLYAELLPEAVARAEADVVYLPNAPWGDELPFRPDSGVANYFGVSAYLQDVTDARRADVRFASECLAFSNIPDPDALGPPVGDTPQTPSWKAGVPRDNGVGWDFEDVRDHYLAKLYDCDPVQLRWTDSARYLELGRVVTGELMAEVLGEWRRAKSSCAGALILWLADLYPGAGWGVIDHRGQPKVALHYLRRACAPVAVWTTDEGLAGVAVHVANDRPTELEATLHLELFRDSEVSVERASVPVGLGPHSSSEHNVESAMGYFSDVNWKYRFGASTQDVIVASLESANGQTGELLSQSFRFPLGRPSRRESAASLGLAATLVGDRQTPSLRVSSRRLAYCVRVRVPGFTPSDDAFSIAPGGERTIALIPAPGADGTEVTAGHLTATNLHGPVALEFS